MAFQQKENSGALFKNDRKEKETHPDYKGDLSINGTNYWISAWLKEGKNGKFLSLSVNMKEAPGISKQVDENPKHKPSTPVQAQTFPDEDIPG